MLMRYLIKYGSLTPTSLTYCEDSSYSPNLPCFKGKKTGLLTQYKGYQQAYVNSR